MHAAFRPVSFCLAGLVTAGAVAQLDDTSIRTAVTAWLTDAAAAEATYGHISAWDTSQVTDMARLFQNSDFNQNINAWDTGAVTTMFGLFSVASKFNQPLNDWDVSRVTNMEALFAEAMAFNQPIGGVDPRSKSGDAFARKSGDAFARDLPRESRAPRSD